MTSRNNFLSEILPRIFNRFLRVGLLFAILLMSVTVVAQSADKTKSGEAAVLSQAQTIWQQAKQDYQQGHYLKTFRLYQQSLRIMELVQEPSLEFRKATYTMQSGVLSLADTLLDQYSNSGSRLLLLRFLLPLYEKTIGTAFDLFEREPDDATFEKAFLLAEQSRNRMLTEAIKSAGLKAFRDVPPIVIEKQQQWSASIFIYRNLLDIESAKLNPNDALVTKYADSLNFFQHQADSMNFYFSQKYPAYYQLMNRQHFATAGQVQQRLKGTHKAVLEYFCGDNALYLFCITPTQRSFHRILRDSMLNQQVLEFQKSILSVDENAFSAPAYYLFETLVAPAKSGLTGNDQIVVIHDGITGTIPFEALLNSSAKKYDGYLQFDYAIRHYCFSYAPSATLWLEHQSDIPCENTRMVGFAPSFSPELKNSYRINCPQNPDSFYLSLPEQRSTLRFAKDITEVIPGTWYTGAEATVANFRSNAEDAGIIHLATHTFFDTENPMNSRVVLVKEGCDTSMSNGYIRASDLYNMRLHASLAILGSCQTGFGKQSRGEGIISLAYAFSYAGCNSLVYSLWSVDEKRTSELMRFFYEGLAEGLPKDRALHQAKLRMLEQSNELTANPLYWAGFVFSGDAAPFIIQQNRWLSYLYWSIGVAGLIALMIFLFMKNKGRKKQI